MAVEGAHRVGPPRHFQPEHRHAERLLVVLGLHAAEAHEMIVRDAQRVAHRSEVLFHQAAVEPVMAGGHRCVGREDGLPGHLADGVVERESVTVHPHPHGLERREDGVPFVEVIDARHDSHRTDRPHAADAEHNFLADTYPRVAAVETARELAVLGRVALDIAIEQVEGHAAHRHLPDLGENRARPRVDLHDERLALRVDGRLDRQHLDPRLQVVLVLIAVDVELLLEVALVVEQSHGDERDTQTAGALDVVAGEHTETTRIDRHRLMDAELRREIDHRL